MTELEQTLIPYGLHVVGEPMPAAARAEYLAAIAEGTPIGKAPRALIDAIVAGKDVKKALAAGGLTDDETTVSMVAELARTNKLLSEDHELPALMRALDGSSSGRRRAAICCATPRCCPPAATCTASIPSRIPSAFAVLDGAQQAARLLARHIAEGNALPESVALVLWGADNLKTERRPDRPGPGAHGRAAPASTATAGCAAPTSSRWRSWAARASTC